VRPAKIRRRTALGENLAIQFQHRIYTTFVGFNLPILCPVCQTPFAIKSIQFFEQKNTDKKSCVKKALEIAARICW
jgi:hypothetical protein